jgi:hypothetical protein
MNDHSETIGFVIGLALIAVVGSVVLGVIAGLTWRVASWVAG